MNEIKISFPELSLIKPFPAPASGQKLVLSATLGARPVMLKLVSKYQNAEERTKREIASAKKLGSTYIPEIIDFGQRTVCGESLDFIIEQFIPGETYRNILQRTPCRDIKSVCTLAATLLSACVDFEKIRVVHRDIKPENLIIDPSGKIWVIDFGLARHLDLPSITSNGLYKGVGTLGYAPPEQFRNQKKEIDSRSDLFSIGLVLYESLAGVNPYLKHARDSLQVLKRMENEDLPKLQMSNSFGSQFSELISCLIQRFPARRPRNAVEAFCWFKTLPENPIL